MQDTTQHVDCDLNVHMFGDFVMIFDDCGHVAENLWGSQICGKWPKTVISDDL